jgi:hypothetical protein
MNNGYPLIPIKCPCCGWKGICDDSVINEITGDVNCPECQTLITEDDMVSS